MKKDDALFYDLSTLSDGAYSFYSSREQLLAETPYFFSGSHNPAAYNIFNSVRTQGLYFERLGGWTDKLAIRLLADRFSSVMIPMVAVMYFVLLIFAAYDKAFQQAARLMVI